MYRVINIDTLFIKERSAMALVTDFVIIFLSIALPVSHNPSLPLCPIQDCESQDFSNLNWLNAISHIPTIRRNLHFMSHFVCLS